MTTSPPPVVVTQAKNLRKPSLVVFFSAVNAGLVVIFLGLLIVTDLGLEKVVESARQTRDVTVPQVVAQHRQAIVASQILRQAAVISSPASSPSDRREALAKAESLSGAFDSSRDMALLERFDTVLGRLNALSYQLDLISLLDADFREKLDALNWVRVEWPSNTPNQDAPRPPGVAERTIADAEVLSLRWLVPHIVDRDRDEALHNLLLLEHTLYKATLADTPTELQELGVVFDRTMTAITRLVPKHPYWKLYRDRTSRLFTVRLDILKNVAAVRRTSEDVNRSLDQLISALSEEAAVLAQDGATEIANLSKSVFWELALSWSLVFILLVAILWLARRYMLVPILAAVSALDRARLGAVLGPLPVVGFRELELINKTVARFSEALLNERNSAEAFAKSEVLYRKLVETIPHGIVSIDAHGIILFENAGHKRLRGLSEGALIGTSIWELFRVSPYEVPPQERLARMLTGELPAEPLEGRYLKRDGTALGVQIDWSQTVGKDENDVGVILIITDVTDRHRALEVEAMARAKELAEDSRRRAEAALEELQSTQKQLIQAEKMASLGTLVAGVSHEVNTPLSTALVSASYIFDETEKLSNQFKANQLRKNVLYQYIQDVAEASQLLLNNIHRACNLVQNFKQVAYDQITDSRRLFNLRLWIEDMVQNLAPKWRRLGHRVEIDCPGDIEMDSYAGALAQILTNLIMNSIDHGYDHGQGGRLLIMVRPCDGSTIDLIYSDDGKGISTEIQGRVFDPFFTTRRASGNTGLGLHIIFNIVTGKLGGHIHLEGRPEKGVRFAIRLPKVSPIGAPSGS